MRNVSNFGKYFILEPKFATIKEEDEDMEAGSLPTSKGRSNSESLLEPKLGDPFVSPYDQDHDVD